MLLTIDVGNTHSSFGVWQADDMLHSWRLATNTHRTEDEYAALLLNLFQQASLEPKEISAAILSSVVPDTVFPLQRCCERYLGCHLLTVNGGAMDLGMQVQIDNPKELGADRLVNAIAAKERYGNGLVIIDFGTATTLDVVDSSGAYVGGIIAPGVNLSLEALQRAAAKLHGVSIEKPEKAIGTNTTSAMQSGLYYGYYDMVCGLVERVKQEIGEKMTVIATGGLADLYAKDNPVVDYVDQELTMRGLYLIHQRNVSL